MPTQPSPYLVLTDGTDTVTFADGANPGGQTNYPFVARTWAPAIAGLKRSTLGGTSPYDPVAEKIQINIVSTVSAADCYAKLDTLARLLDKADRWWLKNENISPVLFKFAPQGSTIHSNATPMQALVIGRAPDDETSSMQLPVVYDQSGMIWQIFNVTVAFIRRGLWTGATESASAAAVANPAVLNITMPSTPNTVGPLEIDFTGFATSATPTINVPSGFVFIGPTNTFSLQEGEAAVSTSLAAGATFTTVADAAARASAGNVGRLNHTGASLNAESVISWTLPAAFLNSTRIAIYCTYRNNFATGWNIRGQAYRSTPSSLASSTTLYQAIAAAATSPTVLFVGVVSNPVGFDTVSLRLGMTVGSGTNTIDIDTVVFVDVSQPQVFALALTGIVGSIDASLASKNVQVTIDNNPNARELPFVHIDVLTTAVQYTRGYTGDAALCVAGNVISAIWYATNSTFWTTQNVGSSATLSIGATVTRRLGYLVPQ